MRKLRKCFNPSFNTGESKCLPDFDKMKGAILVEPGTKLPATLTATALETQAHAARASRIYGIMTFTEYAKNGGEMQTSVNGYGSTEATGMNTRTDTYTLDKFKPSLHSALTRCKNKKWDVYFFDASNMLYGINDGTDALAGFPMAAVYSDATPHPTSSARSTMTVTFAHEDAEVAAIEFDYEQLDFNPQRLTLGLTQVKLEKGADNKYKIFEVMGANDITSIVGPLIATASSSVLNGATAATYDEANDVLAITASDSSAVSLKAPSVLYASEIKGIEQVAS